MKIKKLVLIPLVGIIAAFSILNMEANQKSNSKDNLITVKCKKVTVEEDENPEGVTLLSFGNPSGEASTQGKVKVEEDENPEGVTLLSTEEETEEENK